MFKIDKSSVEFQEANRFIVVVPPQREEEAPEPTVVVVQPPEAEEAPASCWMRPALKRTASWRRRRSRPSRFTGTPSVRDMLREPPSSPYRRRPTGVILRS